MIQTLFPRDRVARALTVSTMAFAMSTGVFYSVSVLYFTRVVGLSAGAVGLGLGVAGGAGVLGSFLAGRWSDRWGAHRVQVWGLVVQASALAAYAFVADVVSFTVVAVLVSAGRGVQGTARQTLLARWFTGAERVEVRARLRVVTNVFIGLGTLAAAVALLLDTAVAYRTAMVGTAVLLLVAVVPLVALPRTVPGLAERLRAGALAAQGAADGGAAPAAGSAGAPVGVPAGTAAPSPWRDRTYLASVALNAVVAMQFGVMTVGVPLWVATTDAPTAVVSALLVVNTVLVALLQVRASRGTHDVRGAGRAVRRGAVLLAVACVVYAAAGHGSLVVATVLLVLAAATHSLGEVLSEAGGWGMAFELADPRRAGEYQGLSQTGYALSGMVAPVVVTALPIRYGAPGWLVLGAIFVAAGVGAAAVARRAADRADPVDAGLSPIASTSR
ncbi:MFS transporter [Isoptericola sp. NEAU-Y5]|uniref:MFS transporter n=1 Tax=Isoptericola luteus TaxID=2879484 RepID=A0ABS7ZK54_9MICO|nr:MFS transporter [Isoptericola sp. NEAU-Y5]MCA5894229.1 MFS transporter [Isoptericola sp. NEAU-Y5]